MYETILVPVDGSEQALAAVDVACQLLGGDSPTIHLLTVPELPRTEGEIRRWAQSAGSGQSGSDIEAEARKALDEAAAAVAAAAVSTPGVSVKHHLLWTHPASAIVSRAEDLGADAIVLGSRGRGSLAGLVLGSVSNKVLHSAKCRVVLVH